MTTTPFNLDEIIHFSNTRQHHYLYAHKVIAGLSLRRNKTFLSMLTDPDSDRMLADLWDETAKQVPENQVMPSDGLKSCPFFKINDNYLLAIITFPPPQKPGEAIYAGIPLHRQSGATRYIMLEKSSKGSNLCEWTADGQHKILPQSLSVKNENLSFREFAALLMQDFC